MPSYLSFVLCALLCAGLSAQTPAPVSAVPVSNQAPVDPLVAASVALRTKVVHQFGTPAEIAAFDHPHESTGTAKRPKIPKSGQVNQETMAAMSGYLANKLEPEQIYVGIVMRLFQTEIVGDSMPQSKVAISAGSVVLALAESMTPGPGSILAAGTLAAAANKANAASQAKQDRAIEDDRAKETEKMIRTILSRTELNQYLAGDYATKAAIFFKAGLAGLERQPVPNTYVLYLCDPSPYSTAKQELEFLASIDSDLHVESVPTLSVTERWVAVTEAEARFLRDGLQAFTGTDRSSEFLRKMPSISGHESQAIFSTLGPEAMKQYTSASEEQKLAIARAAMAMYIAFDMVLKTNILDLQQKPTVQGETSH